MVTKANETHPFDITWKNDRIEVLLEPYRYRDQQLAMENTCARFNAANPVLARWPLDSYLSCSAWKVLVICLLMCWSNLMLITVFSPLPEVSLDRLPCRKVMWQHSSQATTPQHIKDRNLSQHLLCYQPENLEEGIILRVWTDQDYGGFNILAILRKRVSPCFEPYWIDFETLENHSQWTRSLTKTDNRNLKRLFHHLALVDVKPVIVNLLQRILKLE